MFNKSALTFAVFAVLSFSNPVLGRERWLERDGKAVNLYPRRFGQENPAVIGRISSACRGDICGVLAGSAISTLLAASPECAQQDKADEMITAAKTQLTDPAEQANLIALAIEFRQAEKNTPPDFTTNPPTPRNSVFCQKAPVNSELNGLVQAQDPANGDVFFDPVTKSSVLRGSQANTSPFGTSGSGNDAGANNDAGTNNDAGDNNAGNDNNNDDGTEASTPSAPAADATCNAAATATVTVTVTGEAQATSAAAVEASSTEAPAQTAAPTAPAGALDFGSCTDPTIEFGPAFEGRRASEFTFKPVDGTQFAQSSALNGNIVFNAVCNILQNTCQAPDATNQACQAGKTAAAALTGGAAADAFNAALGITTDFENVPAAPGGGPGSVELATTANFGTCTDPTIAFGVGFDGRTEASFQPNNKQSFNHGSALNPNIISTAICDTLVNSCNANLVAINDCDAAKTAANGLTGQAFADAFNAAVTANLP